MTRTTNKYIYVWLQNERTFVNIVELTILALHCEMWTYAVCAERRINCNSILRIENKIFIVDRCVTQQQQNLATYGDADTWSIEDESGRCGRRNAILFFVFVFVFYVHRLGRTYWNWKNIFLYIGWTIYKQCPFHCDCNTLARECKQ